MKLLATVLTSTILVLAGCASEPAGQPDERSQALDDREAGGAPAPAAEAAAPSPTPAPAFSYPAFFAAGASRIAAEIKKLPEPREEVQLESLFNMTSDRLDPREFARTLSGRLQEEVPGLAIAAGEDAPWTLKSKVSSESIRSSEGTTTTYHLELELVEAATRRTLCRAKLTQVDKR